MKKIDLDKIRQILADSKAAVAEKQIAVRQKAQVEADSIIEGIQIKAEAAASMGMDYAFIMKVNFGEKIDTKNDFGKLDLVTQIVYEFCVENELSPYFEWKYSDDGNAWNELSIKF